MNELIATLKEEIIEVLNLEGMTPDGIDDNAPLFNGGDPSVAGLGLDSIDALELIVVLDKNYGIKLKSPAEGQTVFKSINCIADYIQKNRTK